jgi:DinB family protein
MHEEEKASLLESLRVSQVTLIRVLDGVSEDLASRSPGAGRWSILQCVEHINLAEDHMFGLLMTAERPAESVINLRRERLIREQGADRSRRFESPEVAIPAGHFSTLHDGVTHFLKSRKKTIQFVEGYSEDLRGLMMNHPVVGRVNGYETLLLMAVHPLRHARQIEEIRRGQGVH